VTESKAVAEIEKVADRYIAVWNEPHAESRRYAVAGLWTEVGTYTDPLGTVEGRQAIERVIAGVRKQFPGHVFRRIGDADAHHNLVRFSWGLVPEGSDESVVESFDVASSPALGEFVASMAFSRRFPRSDGPAERTMQCY
jgi:hypothetical protein